MQAIKACMLADAELTAKGLPTVDRTESVSTCGGVARLSARGAHNSLATVRYTLISTGRPAAGGYREGDSGSRRRGSRGLELRGELSTFWPGRRRRRA